MDFKVCYGQVGLGAVNLCWARVSGRGKAESGAVGSSQVWQVKGFMARRDGVVRGQDGCVPVWYGFQGWAWRCQFVPGLAGVSRF